MRNGGRGVRVTEPQVVGRGQRGFAGARFTSNVHRQIGLPSLLAEVAGVWRRPLLLAGEASLLHHHQA